MARFLNNLIFALGLAVLIFVGCKQSNSPVAKDVTQMTIAELKPFADTGNPAAEYELGKRFYSGNGILKDSTEAVEWWQKAAAQKFPPAELDLGLAYLKGDGVPKDEREGVRLCHLAADFGLPRAKEAVGMFYFLGVFDFPKDYTNAFYSFKAAANQNYPPAQYYLALCFRDGKGTSTNSSEAVSWLQRAASNGLANAQTRLGRYYADKGLAQVGSSPSFSNLRTNSNFALAFEWFQKAANQGEVGGQMDLGDLYATGCGVDKNPIEACKWLALASASKSNLVASLIKTNNLVFTAEQISAGKLRAEEFSRTNQISPKSVGEILGL